MRTRDAYRAVFCLISILCLAFGTVDDVPSAAASGAPPAPDDDAVLPHLVRPASLQAVAVTDPGPPASSPVIHLKSRQIQPSPANALSPDAAAGLGQERIHVLLQLDYIPRQAAKDALRAQGIELLAYVPDYAWIASLPAADAAAALDLPGVTWIGELTVDDKLDPAIREGRWGDYNLAPDGTAAVYVVLHGDQSLDAGLALVEAHGGTVVGQLQGIKLLVVEMPLGNVRALAGEAAVQWIEPVGPPLTPSNDGIRAQIGVDIVNGDPYNLDGTGVDVLVYDSGQAGDHVDFGTRLTHGDGDSVSDHSTHVAGTVGGDGSNSVNRGGTALQWRGMAPAVDLISYGTSYPGSGVIFYENVPDIEADWDAARNTHGADLGTASLGSNIYYNYPTRCDLMGLYGASSVLIDQIVRGGNSTVGLGEKYIATWAAGNERGWGTSCATYGIVAPPAAAKNPIHVGGSNTNNNTQYAHTSWGPTQDGRIKPIVTAGACQTSGDGGVTSTDDSPVNYYTVKCGTSMATPAVAGGIALMLQHYRDVYNTTGRFWPSAAKAILMQTATDLGRAGPDYEWGYGQVNIHAAVDLISRRAFRQDNVAQGAVDVYSMIVPEGLDPLTVSLAWDDHEATLNANPTLINNLDLELVSPSGALWRPWVLNAGSPTADATRGLDNRNNQEQVQVPTPEVGTWIVRVRGTTVPQGPQDYGLACEGCKPLNVGVCQATVETGGVVRATLGGEDEHAVDALAEPSEGELWQRALEAGAPPEGEPVRLFTESGEAVYAPPGPAARPAPEAERVQEADALIGASTALDGASEDGAEALRAFRETLSPEMLDLLNDEISRALERLAASPPPRPQADPLSEADERAMVASQDAEAAASRARAYAVADDPAENSTPYGAPSAEPGLGAAQDIGIAADLTVGSGCTYATIAAAVAAANPGDRLLIEGGVTFAENVTVDKNLALQGGYAGCASASTADTTIDGGNSGTVVVVNQGLNVTLENLVLTNGLTALEGGGIQFAKGAGTGTLTLNNVAIHGNQAQWGGGIWVGINAQVTGTGVQIHDNAATTYGGGVRLYGGRITLQSSNIYQNSAPWGGGVYGSRIDTYAPQLNLPSSADVLNNQALSGAGQGGGVYLRQGTVSLADCSDIYSNDAVEGGGAYVVTSTVTVEGECSEIQSNTATGHGGGVYAQGSTIYLDNDAEFLGNSAGTDTTGYGGGAYLDDSDLYGDKARIRNNTAYQHGGGAYATNGSRVDMRLDTYPCLGGRCSRLYGNWTATLYGGGIYAYNSTVELRNTYVESNSANLGGGVYAYNSTVNAYDSLFARNEASGTGDGIRLYNGSTMTGQGSTFAYNDTGGAATGTAIGILTADLTLSCSIVWGHSTGIDSSTVENVTYSDIQGGYDGAGNLNTNPLFVASGSEDYHLQTSSPVVDRCLSGSSTDFDDETRPIVRGTAASPYDMGADEVAGVDRVGVNGTCAYATIQQAVNAAQDGDTVRVAAGVYFENVVITDKSITVEGGYDSTCSTVTGGETRVEGSAGSGNTVAIGAGTTVLRHLDIAWGSGYGGGVQVAVGAHVTLDDSDVYYNHGSYGGGIYVAIGGVMTVTNGSEVRDNTASIYGGGARVWGAFYGYDNTSDIHGNCAPHGGGFDVPGGTLYLNAADAYQNEAADAQGLGGGIRVINGGVVTLTNSSYVYYDNRAYDGAGIHADASTVHLIGGGTVLRDNIASHYGGAVYLGNGSTLYSSGARIGQTGGEWLANEAYLGAGIYALNSTIDFSGYIINNMATSYGGGIYADASTVRLTNAQVGGTGTNEGNRLGPSGYLGAGMYLTNGTQATLEGTVVSSNAFQGTAVTYGGGAYLLAGSTMTLTNSTVEHHVAPSTAEGRGAGVYVSDSTLVLDASHVLSNTAGTVGGGIRMWNTSTVVVSGGSTIGYNDSLNGEGGAIAATGTPSVTIADATLMHNSAATYGGAIYVGAGTLAVDRAVLHHNSAQRGGAIYQAGSASADFQNVLAYANTASAALGGGIYAAGGNVVMTHVTLADNLVGAGYAQSGTSSSVYNSIAWGNAVGGFTGSYAASSCNIDQSGNAGSNVDPLFGGGGDYRLTRSSPAVDACASSTPTDLDGVPRPLGLGYDMGAYEYLYYPVFLPYAPKGW